ncbi:MAG TPA: bifunctional phosphopantothenoylcysteine decarboxylase/phosphopantothenate--cysteine ligase CoaBC [Firmicutes bacterium]|jgi:phosphopantothenoylcysteine decarboxylase/phosphopantothenate--cysteine ligase|nr:bifunctional phosphopantothenoylcysteine decarboxylase/phosphopantothenate--cysteine ligase CoaBC [Bacillota bacterium]
MKRVIVGITGGIASYKAAEVVRGLCTKGIEVHVLMTEAATRFITPLTLQTLSGNPVVVDMFAEPRLWNVQHVAYAKKADLILVAPATASFIGRLTAGIADDMVSATILATTAPVVIAPAMNSQMYRHPAVQANLNRLREMGYQLIAPGVGELACGDRGEGRLAEVSQIIDQVLGHLLRKADLAGKNLLVTAGPTREYIDPVRFISNPASGKMGYALAAAARDRGAEVVLVSGPTAQLPPPGVKVSRVTTTAEMLAAVLEHFPAMDVVIKAAAVVDYRPQTRASQKLKKGSEQYVLTLERNPDILKILGERKGDKILVGFAAETQDLIENAREKIKAKNLDLIVANDVGQRGAGFGTDTNIAAIIHRDGTIKEIPLCSKQDLAHRILDEVVVLTRGRKS